jgi:hypothetical protein
VCLLTGECLDYELWMWMTILVQDVGTFLTVSTAGGSTGI